MSIGRMRWSAGSALAAAGAAAAMVLALAVPAGASTGTTELSPEQAGYTATGAQFASAGAEVYLRQPAQYAAQVTSFGHSVQLWSSGLVLVVGVTASTSGSGYTPYAKIYDTSTHQLLASDPNAQWCDVSDNCSSTIGTIPAGETVLFNVVYHPKNGDVVLDASPGIGEGGFSADYQAGTGVSFTQARMGTDFGSSPWDASYPHTPPAQYTKAGAFSHATLTTYSGHTSSLWSWWVHHQLLANTEQQSSADWVAIPTNLTSGGTSFQTYFVPQSAQGPKQPVRR